MRVPILWVAAGLAAGVPSVASASDLKSSPRLGAANLSFEIPDSTGATLTVSGPNGFAATTHSRGRAIGLDLPGPIADGVYTYQLHAATQETVTSRDDLDNGRARNAPPARHSAATSGTFIVQSGAIQPPGRSEEPRDGRK
jgi:hypothetical protein